jgi:hypothetical protein
MLRGGIYSKQGNVGIYVKRWNTQKRLGAICKRIHCQVEGAIHHPNAPSRAIPHEGHLVKENHPLPRGRRPVKRSNTPKGQETTVKRETHCQEEGYIGIMGRQ